jgi:flagellar biosynthesis protein FliQ
MRSATELANIVLAFQATKQSTDLTFEGAPKDLAEAKVIWIGHNFMLQSLRNWHSIN